MAVDLIDRLRRLEERQLAHARRLAAAEAGAASVRQTWAWWRPRRSRGIRVCCWPKAVPATLYATTLPASGSWVPMHWDPAARWWQGTGDPDGPGSGEPVRTFRLRCGHSPHSGECRWEAWRDDADPLWFVTGAGPPGFLLDFHDGGNDWYISDHPG